MTLKRLSKIVEFVEGLPREVVFDGGMGSAVLAAAGRIGLQVVALELLGEDELDDLCDMKLGTASVFKIERCWDCDCPVGETEEKELVMCLWCGEMVCHECWIEHRRLGLVGVH